MKSSNYGAARGVLATAEFLMWCGVAIGVIIAVLSAGAASRGFGSPGLIVAVPGLVISAICFLGVVLAQIGKAGVDSADYSYQMLSVARDQLEVSRQSLKLQQSAPRSGFTGATVNTSDGRTDPKLSSGSFASRRSLAKVETSRIEPASDHEDVKIRYVDYRGKRIHSLANGGYWVDDRTFVSLARAKEFLDRAATQPRSLRDHRGIK